VGIAGGSVLYGQQMFVQEAGFSGWHVGLQDVTQGPLSLTCVLHLISPV
jgi:hypothetical protein